MQGMYGLEITHPQYPWIVRLPGEVATNSLCKDGQALLNKPNKQMTGEEQHRQVQASPNRLTPRRWSAGVFTQAQQADARQGAAKTSLTSEYQARRRKDTEESA